MKHEYKTPKSAKMATYPIDVNLPRIVSFRPGGDFTFIHDPSSQCWAYHLGTTEAKRTARHRCRLSTRPRKTRYRRSRSSNVQD